MGPIRTEIRTPRLTLRPPRNDDAASIAGLMNDFDVVRMLSSAPWPYSAESATEFLERTSQLAPEREQVFVAELDRVGAIGVFGLTRKDDPLTELGYWIGRPFWGCGFATEAASALMTWAAESWGLRALIAGHFADNTASGNVLCKAGFLYTGEVRQRFSRARGEPAPTRMMVWLA